METEAQVQDRPGTGMQAFALSTLSKVSGLESFSISTSSLSLSILDSHIPWTLGRRYLGFLVGRERIGEFLSGKHVEGGHATNQQPGLPCLSDVLAGRGGCVVSSLPSLPV